MKGQGNGEMIYVHIETAKNQDRNRTVVTRQEHRGRTLRWWMSAKQEERLTLPDDLTFNARHF